jgi:nucleolin
VKPRSITTITPAAFRSRQQWFIPVFQRRFASNEVDVEKTKAEEENFSQTATEQVPIEENSTPNQDINAGASVGADALNQKLGSKAPSGRSHPSVEPSTTVYVGNLYYEVTPEQLTRVFSRFGEVGNVKVIYDNRGLSRGCVYFLLSS